MVDVPTNKSALDSSLLFGRDIFYVVVDLTLEISTKNLGPFLSQAWVDSALRWRAINDVGATYHPMHHRQILDWEDTLEECKMMGAMYVQPLVDSLNKRFHDLHVLFSL